MVPVRLPEATEAILTVMAERTDRSKRFYAL